MSSTKYYTSLQRSQTIESAIVGMVKNFWYSTILNIAGEQRNANAWEYWNKIPNDVINNSNISYVIYASTDLGGNNEVIKLDSKLTQINANGAGSATLKGISLDISDKYVFQAEDEDGAGPNIRKYNKDLSINKLDNTLPNHPHHITYGSDNFLYISTDSPSIEKWDPISMTKVQENTDLWLTQASIGSSGDTFQYIKNSVAYNNDDWDEDGDGNLDSNESALDANGSWNFPSVSFGQNPNVKDESFAPNLPWFQPPSFIDTSSDGKHSLRMDFTVNVRDNETYQLHLHSNDGSKLWIDQGNGFTKIQVNAGNDNTVITFRDSDILTEIDTDNDGNFNVSSTYSGGPLATGDVLKLTIAEGGYTATPDVIFAYRKLGESDWRNIPVFSGGFGYLNYDPDGFLYAQNDYGIFKWDAVNMICQEAQPLSNKNEQNVFQDIALTDQYIITNTSTLSTDPDGDGMNEYSTQNGLLKLKKSDLIQEQRKNSADVGGRGPRETIHFVDENNFLWIEANTSVIYKQPIDLTQDTVAQFTISSHIFKITVLPNGYIVIGLENGDIVKLNSDLTDTGKSYNLGSACTGLVYDVE